MFLSYKLMLLTIPVQIITSKCLLHFRKGKNHLVFKSSLLCSAMTPCGKTYLKRGGISSEYSMEIQCIVLAKPDSQFWINQPGMCWVIFFSIPKLLGDLQFWVSPAAPPRSVMSNPTWPWCSGGNLPFCSAFATELPSLV